MTRFALLLLVASCAKSDGVKLPDAGDDDDAPIVTTGPTPEAPVESGDLGDMILPEIIATPPGCTFNNSVEVILETPADPDADIWFTTDGSAPQIGVGNLYAGPTMITQSVQIRAIAEVSGQLVGTSPTYLSLDPGLDGFSSDIPLVVLWSQRAAPTTKLETYEKFTMSVFEPPQGGRIDFPSDATLSVRSGLRVRGSSSSGFEKKPYRLESWDPIDPLDVDMDVELLGMPAEADWVFLSPLVFDRALMRNALIYQLSNNINRYAPRTRFAEVFVAEWGEVLGLDDYKGVYVILERVERDADRVALTRLEATDIALPELSGGYIFKEDRLGPGDQGFVAGDGGGAFDFEQPFVFSEPSEAEIQPEQYIYMRDLIDELGDALVQPNFTNPVTGRHYDQIVDVDSFIDHHILNVFTKNPDAFRLSGYFHKDRDGLLMAGPIWDFDRTMGCADDSRAGNPTWWDPSNETNDCTFVFEHGLWLGFFNDPVFRTRYFQRWDDLLLSDLSLASVGAVIDDMEAELAEAAPRNFSAWPGYPPRGGSFESEVNMLRVWVQDRHAWVTNCLALPDPRSCIGT